MSKYKGKIIKYIYFNLSKRKKKWIFITYINIFSILMIVNIKYKLKIKNYHYKKKEIKDL